MMPSTRRAKRSTKTNTGAITAIVVLAAVFGLVAYSSFRKARGSSDVVDSIPRPTQYVVDQAGIIDPASRTKLLGFLQELEQKTTAQFLILTVKTTGGMPIEEFALAVAEKWRLGQKGKDNGLLVAVAVDDREYKIEVGSGLEGALPDGFVGGVGREYFVPYFRQGKYGDGLYHGSVAILRRLEQEYSVQLSGLPRGYASPAAGGGPTSSGKNLFGTIMIAIFALIVIASWTRRARYYGGWGPYGSTRGWGSGSGGGWSGGGGGGFGSFGGGGGGGFSGGGASGRW